MNNKIEIYKNNTLIRRFYFYNLLDGLHYIANLDFDYIIVDDERTIKRFEFRRYFETINDFYKRVYGTWYELEEVFA